MTGSSFSAKASIPQKKSEIQAFGQQPKGFLFFTQYLDYSEKMKNVLQYQGIYAKNMKTRWILFEKYDRLFWRQFLLQEY